MATITFTFLDNGVTLALPYELSQADFDRIVKWWRDAYKDPPLEDGTPAPVISRKKAAQRATKGTVQGWIDGSVRDEKIAAASGAADAVPPIEVTDPPASDEG